MKQGDPIEGAGLAGRRTAAGGRREPLALLGAVLALTLTTLLGAAPTVYAETYRQAVEGTAGLAHFWPMGESSGASFGDIVGGANAEVSGGVTLGQPGGLLDESTLAALFDGSSGAAHAGVNLSGTSKLTIEFWMKWKAFAGDNKLALEFTSNFNEHPGGFLVDPDATPGTEFAVTVGKGTSSTANSVSFARPSAEQWHYYAFVINTGAPASEEVIPYVDGHAVPFTKLVEHTGAGNFANSTLYWMSRDASTLFGAGSMQELALYETALSASTIAEHYEIGEGGPKASFSSTPVAATAGVPVHLNASESFSPGGTITDYGWDFDGSKSYSSDGGGSPTLSHTFSSPGSYTVDLRVKDSLGETAVVSRTITVGTALPAYEQAVEETSGLAHFWPMGESSGSTFEDAFAGANASLVGGVTLGQSGGLVGNAATAALFDGISGAAHAGVNLSGTSKLTIEFWMKWKAFAGDNKLALEFTSNFNEHPGGFLVDPDATPGTEFAVTVGKGTSNTTNSVSFARPSAEQWHYYTFVINTGAPKSEEVIPYVDGHAVSFTKLYEDTGAGNFANSTLYWMSRDASTLFGAGSMQELALYETDLSAATILEHYERGENTYHVVNSTPPSIEGTAKDGQTLTVNRGAWTGFEPISYAYQWERCNSSGEGCANISGATSSTYALGHGDVGDALRVIVTASNAGSSAESTSEKTSVVAALAPSNMTLPAISGTAEDEQTLSAGAGEWAGTPTLEYAYQWERCNSSGGSCANIAGATNSTYTLGDGDVGGTIRVRVTSSNTAGSTSAASEATAVVAAPIGLFFSAQFGSYGSSDGQFQHPADVALNGEGDVLVLDRGGDRVEEFNEAGEYSRQFGSPGAGNGELKSPLGLAVDPHGDVWVLDAGNERLEEFNKEGEFVRTAGAGTVARAEGIAVDHLGDVWVSATYEGKLMEFNGEGEYQKSVGSEGSGSGQLDEPEGLAFDSSDDLWVAEWGNNRVQEFNDAGEYIAKFGVEGSGQGQIKEPYGIAVGGRHVFVGEVGNDRVQEFDEDGGFVEQLDTEGSEPGPFELDYPIGLAISSTEDLWITDPGNERVEKWTPQASIAPSNTTPPSIAGTTQAGETLTADVGSWTARGTISYAYQWQRCNKEDEECAGIAGASGSTYVPGRADIAEELRVIVTASNRAGRASATSGPTAKVAPAPAPVNTETPTITGVPKNGQTLTASTGSWTTPYPPLSYNYQWQRCSGAGDESCSDISGATNSTYTLTEADSPGSALRVVVTAANVYGSSASSAPAARFVARSVRVTEYTYDAEGNLASRTDGDGHTTTYTYGPGGEPTKITEPNGTVTETGYNGDGQVTSQMDGDKHTTKYVRNVLGEVAETIDPRGRKTSDEYDAAGNLASVTDPDGRTTTYTYDADNRPVEVAYSDGKTPTVKYEYDADGNRTKMVDGTGATTYSYNQLDELTETTDGHGDTLGYEYNLAGESTKIAYPNGKAVERAYDEDGLLSSVKDWLGNTTSFVYDPDSNLTTITFPEGTGETDRYAYNDAGEMSEAGFGEGSEALASLSYARDDEGQVTNITSKGLPGEEGTEYSYDQNNRLTQAGSTSYEYDAAGNPTKTGSSTNAYDQADELEHTSGAGYAYNEVGERTTATPSSGPATSYGYDQAGNLTSVQRPEEGSTPKLEDSYTYNGEGLRASETSIGATSHLTWGSTGEQLPVILSNEADSFIYGPGNLPIEQINNTTGKVQYLHHDQAGSTRLITGSTGTVEGKCTYSAYGTPTCEGTATTPLGFDGEYTNSDTGLIYMRARVYDPSTAQFLSVDPLEVITGEPYNFAGDDPLAYSDPSGEGLVSFLESAASTVACGFGGPEACADEQLVVTDAKVVYNDVDAILNPCRATEDREKSIADVLGAGATVAGSYVLPGVENTIPEEGKALLEKTLAGRNALRLLGGLNGAASSLAGSAVTEQVTPAKSSNCGCEKE